MLANHNLDSTLDYELEQSLYGILLGLLLRPSIDRIHGLSAVFSLLTTNAKLISMFIQIVDLELKVGGGVWCLGGAVDLSSASCMKNRELLIG